MSISLCMIAGDECPGLARALGSARSFTEEMVVVHTGEGGETPKVAREQGARVLATKWVDFAQARNVSLEAARGDWIFILDADEEVESPQAVEQLRPLMERKEADAFLVCLRSPQASGGQEEVFYPRLFRRDPALRFEHAVHEQLTLEGHKVLCSDIVIFHKGYSDPVLLKRKERRNLEYIQKLPQGLHRLYFEIRTLFSLGRFREIPPLLDELLLLEGGRLAPGRMDVYFHGVLTFLKLGELERAEKLLWEGLEAYPDSVDLSFALLYMAALRHAESVRRAGQEGHPLFGQRCFTHVYASVLRDFFRDRHWGYAFVGSEG